MTHERTLFFLGILALATVLGLGSLAAQDDQAHEDHAELDRRPDEARSYDRSELYNRVCVTCHGPDGDGQGLAIQLFSFGAPEAEWRNGPTIEGIVITLEEGFHHTSMRPFPEYSEADRVALAEYVLELREALLAEE